MKKKIDFESLWQIYGKNPYLSKFNKTKRVRDDKKVKYKYHDNDPFVKIYFDIKGVSVLELFFNRTQEFKVFCYVLKNLGINTGLVEINYSHCASCMGISNKQVSRGVSFLLKHDIISKSGASGYFYVNPDIAFNGDKFGLSLYRVNLEREEKESKKEAMLKEMNASMGFNEIRKAYEKDGYVPKNLLGK
jgi:hypothetical protein